MSRETEMSISFRDHHSNTIFSRETHIPTVFYGCNVGVPQAGFQP